jgi:transposase-like protein
VTIGVGHGTRRLDHTTFPYVYLDATYLHLRNTTTVTTIHAYPYGQPN